MKKWTLRIVALLVFVGLFVLARFIGTAPELPEESEETIDELFDQEPPSLHEGVTGFAVNDGINIWYEVFEPTDSIRGTILLIMGYGTTAINWSDYFYQPLVDEGYRVVRYDNRGIGMSDWLPTWSAKTAYDLSDMAGDGLAVLDALDIQQAHVAGVSMGGMIAQQMSIDFSERVLSLTSIMSSGFIEDPDLPPVPSTFIRNVQKLGLKYLLIRSDRNAIRFSLGMAELLKGSGPYRTDLSQVINRTLFELQSRKGFNPKAGRQHGKAIELSGSRYEQLSNISVPSLVIHGISDPLIPIAHSKKYAALIPAVDTLWIDGMGHDIPPLYTGQVHEAMLRHYGQKADL